MQVNRNFDKRPAQDDLFYSPNFQEKLKKTSWKNFFSRLRSYFRIFFSTSSIHGLNHLVAIGRHSLEITLWMGVVCLSIYGSVYLSLATWLRYQSSPSIISMERDMFAWNTTFPSVTICPDRKIDPKKLRAFVEDYDESEREKLEAFLIALSNTTYENIDLLPEFDGLRPSQYMDTILKLTPSFTPTLTIGAAGISLQIERTITEMGICYAVNSKVAIYNSPAYRIANRWDKITKYNDTFFVHPLDGEVFAQVINLSTSYDVYIHGPSEVPDIVSKNQHSAEDFYMKLYVTATTVYTKASAAKLSVAQRRCRFLEENVLAHSAVYTYNMCRMDCRVRLALRYCRCVPHFYRHVALEQICDVQGLRCLEKYKEQLMNLRTKVNSSVVIDCECLPNCDDVNYVIQSYVLQEWFLGTNLQWGIVTYPRMRYSRDIIFGFTDVLVAVGSMAGLFLGCSVLSFMEIIYFMTLRLFWYIVGK